MWTNRAGPTGRSPRDVTAPLADSAGAATDRGCAPSDYFEACCLALRAAGARTGFLDRDIAIGDHGVRLRFAGAAILDRLYPALAHLAVPPPGTPGLTVGLWDERASGIALPPPPRGAGRVVHGRVSGLSDERVLGAVDENFGSLSLLDRERGLALFHAPDAERIPSYETAFPLRAILNAWLCPRGIQIVHAGAVGTADGGALLVGRGGSGKSNTCLACLCDGMLYAGDDYVAVGTDDAPTAYSLFGTAKLLPSDVGRFARLARSVVHTSIGPDEKSVLFLDRQPELRPTLSLPLRAILLPTVSGRADTRARPATPAQCLKAMAPSTVFQLPGAGRGEFQAMARLAARLAGYVLELGTDRAAIPRVVRDLLASVPDRRA